MSLPQEYVWLCNYGQRTWPIDDLTLEPMQCGEVVVEALQYANVKAGVEAGELCIHSGYFAGGRQDEACPQFTDKNGALTWQVAKGMRTSVAELSDKARAAIDEALTDGSLASLDDVAAIVKKAKAAEKVK